MGACALQLGLLSDEGGLLRYDVDALVLGLHLVRGVDEWMVLSRALSIMFEVTSVSVVCTSKRVVSGEH